MKDNIYIHLSYDGRVSSRAEVDSLVMVMELIGFNSSFITPVDMSASNVSVERKNAIVCLDGTFNTYAAEMIKNGVYEAYEFLNQELVDKKNRLLVFSIPNTIEGCLATDQSKDALWESLVLFKSKYEDMGFFVKQEEPSLESDEEAIMGVSSLGVKVQEEDISPPFDVDDTSSPGPQPSSFSVDSGRTMEALLKAVDAHLEEKSLSTVEFDIKGLSMISIPIDDGKILEVYPTNRFPIDIGAGDENVCRLTFKTLYLVLKSASLLGANSLTLHKEILR